MTYLPGRRLSSSLSLSSSSSSAESPSVQTSLLNGNDIAQLPGHDRMAGLADEVLIQMSEEESSSDSDSAAGVHAQLAPAPVPVAVAPPAPVAVAVAPAAAPAPVPAAPVAGPAVVLGAVRNCCVRSWNTLFCGPPNSIRTWAGTIYASGGACAVATGFATGLYALAGTGAAFATLGGALLVLQYCRPAAVAPAAPGRRG
jgi:hypothetical protein